MNKCYWVTGLSATGKTTLSKLLVDNFRASGRVVVHLDGDELRQVLSDEAYTREVYHPKTSDNFLKFLI